MEARLHQVNARRVPLVLGAALLEADVAARVELSDQPIYILLLNIVNFLFRGFVQVLELLEIVLSLLQTAEDEGLLLLDV